MESNDVFSDNADPSPTSARQSPMANAWLVSFWIFHKEEMNLSITSPPIQSWLQLHWLCKHQNSIQSNSNAIFYSSSASSFDVHRQIRASFQLSTVFVVYPLSSWNQTWISFNNEWLSIRYPVVSKKPAKRMQPLNYWLHLRQHRLGKRNRKLSSVTTSTYGRRGGDRGERKGWDGGGRTRQDS